MVIAVLAQEWARERVEKSPRHHECVTVKHDGRSVESFVVYPEVKEKATAVLVIHEIFGLTDWVRSVADQLAAAGLPARAYHAGLDTPSRTAVQDWWTRSDRAIVVATIAFGMGINKLGPHGLKRTDPVKEACNSG